MTGPFARPLPGSLDLVWSVLGSLHAQLGAALAAMGAPEMVSSALVELVMWCEFAAVGFVVGWTVRRLRESGTVARPAALGAALVALGLIAWTLLRGVTLHSYELFLRPDHLLLAGAAGLALEPLPAVVRRLLLAVLSAVLIAQHYGVLPVAVIAGGGLLGVGAARLIGHGRRALLIASQVAVIAAILGLAFWWRSRSPLLGIALQGLAFFLLLRHASWAWEVARGVVPNAVDYCHYLLFYPGASGYIGAPEVFDEFRRRNLTGQPQQPDPHVGRQLLYGALYVWLARRIPVSSEMVVASTDVVTVWTLQALFWVEVALFLTGVWMMVDAVALLLGVRLRQNFAHLLQCENPSDLWRSVRGTLTFWLVYHVYQPLGGNRGAQELHMLGALAVSLAWHLLAVPSLAIPLRPMHFAPFTLWAVINGAALIGHVHARRHGWRLLPPTTPVWLRRAIHRVLTLLLGSLAVTLPSFQVGNNVDQFIPFVRTLVGLGP